MSSKEPSRKQQMSQQDAAISMLKEIPLGEKGEALLQDLKNDEKCGAAALAILRIVSAKVSKEGEYSNVISALQALINSLTKGVFEVTSGKLLIDSVLGASGHSGPALDGMWNIYIDDNEEGDARVCKCYHSSYPLFDENKEAERKSMDATFKSEDLTLSGECGFMFVCDNAFYNKDEAVPEETVAWLNGDTSTKWSSYHAALATDALLVHAATEKAYGFMIEISDEQVVTLQKNSDDVIVGICFETNYDDDDDDDDDEEFDGSAASGDSEEEDN